MTEELIDRLIFQHDALRTIRGQFNAPTELENAIGLAISQLKLYLRHEKSQIKEKTNT